MATIYSNFQQGTISAAITTTGQTSISSAAFASLPAVASPNILYLILDPSQTAGAAEIVTVTAHTASATSVTVTRGSQSTTARTHALGTTWSLAWTKADADDAFTPSGSIMMYAGATAPTGWLVCDGTPVSRTIYAALFGAISTRYGTGDGSNTFNLPNLVTRLPKGIASGAPTVPSTLASTTANLAHSHALANLSLGNQSAEHSHAIGTYAATSNSGDGSANHTHAIGNYAASSSSGDQSPTNHTHTVTDTYNASGSTTSGTKTTSIQSVNHSHTITTNLSGSSGASGTLHTHAVTTNLSGSSALSATNHSHALSSGATDSQLTTHSHTVDTVELIFIIKI